MELRHLRCFLAVAEELHFSRAAERLHIEQSPLSRVIKELEEELGARLFDRNRRGTRLTPAGQVFRKDVHRLFTILEQARENVRSVASGRQGTLRIAVSDGAIEPRLSAWLARCREEEPEVEVQIVEVPLAEQLRGLREGHFDAGLARADDTGNDIVTHAVWHDPLLLALPMRHPLLAHAQVPMTEVVRYPVIACHAGVCEGYCRQVGRLLLGLPDEPNLVGHATSLNMMLTLVAAGYGIGFVTTDQMVACRHPDVVVRPILESNAAVLKTYVLRLDANDSEQLSRFIARLSPP
ncbi:LysR family transcriptional regulator [Pseudomonas nabeulensis]|uniref:LysR family transcriptional regulator n=1 Tax=Pseudomonas nabeulensis TaxID=2293833 RepID=A0A4Z0ANJ8_9PSED|nr:LysR family transcriptional regulator [Pseudomonas nabeulensis]TFY87729.1 LysR family transcriptional regulator [Pseudomonas nabeulensis]